MPRLVVLALLLTGCPGIGDPTVSVSPPPGTERGGTLRVTMVADVDSLDPHRASSPPSWFFARALHRGLLAFPPDGDDPVPDLATEVPSAQERRYEFTLRDGVRFAPGGDPVRATDVAASLARVVRAGDGVARFLGVIRGAGAVARGRARRLSGVATPDDRTVVITLRRRAPDLPWILAHPQIAILPASTPPAGSVSPPSIAGLGPYTIERYEPERRIALVRNPAWRNDPVRGAWLDAIEATIGGGAVAGVARGTADLALDPGPPDLVPLAGLDAERSEPACVRYLFLNTRVAPFTTRVARIAVARAVRRAAWPGRAPAATGLLAPAVDGHREHLAVAERASPGIPSRARLVVGRSPRDRAEARALRSMLARAGMDLSVRLVDPSHLVPLHYADPAARVPMGIATWCADWPGRAGRNVLGTVADPRAVRSSAPNLVFSGLRSRPVEMAIARAERSGSAAHWAAASAAVERTGALIPLVFPLEEALVGPRVRGFTGAAMWPRGDPASLWLGPPG